MVVVIGNDALMKHMPTSLYDNRFRSKAPSAGHLSPDDLEFSNMKDLFLFVLVNTTQSGWVEEMVEGD